MISDGREKYDVIRLNKIRIYIFVAKVRLDCLPISVSSELIRPVLTLQLQSSGLRNQIVPVCLSRQLGVIQILRDEMRVD